MNDSPPSRVAKNSAEKTNMFTLPVPLIRVSAEAIGGTEMRRGTVQLRPRSRKLAPIVMNLIGKCKLVTATCHPLVRADSYRAQQPRSAVTAVQIMPYHCGWSRRWGRALET